MRVGEARCTGHDAWVYAHKEEGQVRGDGVAEEADCGGGGVCWRGFPSAGGSFW